MSSALNVWHLSPWFPTKANPGMGVFITDWLRLGGKLGPQSLLHFNRVSWRDLFSSRQQAFAGNGFWNEGGILGWRGNRVERMPKQIGSHSGAAFALSAPGMVNNWLAQLGRPDVLLAHNAQIGGQVGRVLKELLNVPLVVVEHSGPFESVMRTAHQRDAFSKVAASAEVLVGVSEQQRLDMLTYLDGGLIEVLANPLRMPRVSIRTDRQDGVVRVLSVGSLVGLKGFDLLIGAMAHIKELGSAGKLVLRIVGDGPDRAALAAQVAASGMGQFVEFTGHLPRAEVEAQYEWCDLYVQASRTESFCIAAADALMRGIPSIVTQCGGPEMFARPAGARMIPVEDSQSLAAAIDDFASGRWNFDREHARQIMETSFGEEAFVRNLGRILALACDRHRGS